MAEPKAPEGNTAGSTSVSPLSEANPASLETVFSTDPLQLTDREIDVVVEALRAKRVQWQQDEAKGRRSAAKEPVKSDLSLKDLGLEL